MIRKVHMKTIGTFDFGGNHYFGGSGIVPAAICAIILNIVLKKDPSEKETLSRHDLRYRRPCFFFVLLLLRAAQFEVREAEYES